MPEVIVKLGDNIVQKYFFAREDMRIGRSPENEIVIENLAVSRCHAIIEQEDDRYVLSDLDSANGTFVNGVRIKRTEIMDRDVITIGKHQLYFYHQHAKVDGASRVPTFIDVESTMLVEPVTPRGRLTVLKGKQQGMICEVTGQLTTLGRSASNNVRLTDWFVSRRHAEIERRPQGFLIRDLGSWRHTLVNGEEVEETPLHDGDVIQLGSNVELAFTLLEQNASEAPMLRRPMELDETVDPMPAEEPPMLPDFPGPPPSLTSQQPPFYPPEKDRFKEFIEQPAAEAASEEPPFPDANEPAPAGPVDGLVKQIAATSVQAAAEALAQIPDGAFEDPSQPPPNPELAAEVELWERALQNKNPIIRKQAARRLKQLTGKDYAY